MPCRCSIRFPAGNLTVSPVFGRRLIKGLENMTIQTLRLPLSRRCRIKIPVGRSRQYADEPSGAHAPFFTRNIGCIIKDNAGHTGRKRNSAVKRSATLEDAIPPVVENAGEQKMSWNTVRIRLVDR